MNDGLSAVPAWITGNRLIQDSYRRRWGALVVEGSVVEIVYRHQQTR